MKLRKYTQFITESVKTKFIQFINKLGHDPEDVFDFFDDTIVDIEGNSIEFSLEFSLVEEHNVGSNLLPTTPIYRITNSNSKTEIIFINDNVNGVGSVPFDKLDNPEFAYTLHCVGSYSEDDDYIVQEREEMISPNIYKFTKSIMERFSKKFDVTIYTVKDLDVFYNWRDSTIDGNGNIVISRFVMFTIGRKLSTDAQKLIK